MNYDTSQHQSGMGWPVLQNGVWEFFMPELVIPKLNHRQILMDYNFWASINGAKGDDSLRDRATDITLTTYEAAYQAAFNGNRAPLVIGNHFNSWLGGGLNTGVEKFMDEVCGKPDTKCATYSEVIQWMGMQDPNVLDQWRKMPRAQT